MATTFEPNELVTEECILSYVNLLEAKQINNVGVPQYSVKLLIRKDDKVTMDKLRIAKEAAKQMGLTEEGKFVFSKMSPERLAEMTLSLQDGDLPKHSDSNPENKGHWLLNVKSPKFNKKGVEMAPPGVIAFVNGVKESVKPGGLNVTEIYSGMKGHVHLRLFPYDTSGNQGIGASLQNVIKTKDGDPLGGSRKKAEDVFGEMASPFESMSVGSGAGSPL